MPESRRLQLRLESKVDSVDAAEFIVAGLAREAGYEPERVDRLGMAVREAMVNAVTHGNGYSQSKSVHFLVERNDAGIRISVRDEGEGFDPHVIPDPTQPENLLKTSGRGLLLMRSLVDEFSAKRGSPAGTEVQLTLHAPDASRG